MPTAPAFYRMLDFPRRGPLTRREFQNRLVRILGVTPVAGFMPRLSDTTTTTCPWSGKVLTADATMAGQLTALGRGASRAFVSASSRYLTTPDVADLSFGNGTTDSAVSIFALVNVTDTAAFRTICSKYNTAGREYIFGLLSTDVLTFQLTDESVPIGALRSSDSPITQGSPVLLSVSYSGLGGATAANGITLYQNGAAIPSTVTNNATYVAMENLGAAFEVGSASAHTALFLDGGVSFLAVAPVNASAAMHANVVALCRSYFGVPT